MLNASITLMCALAVFPINSAVEMKSINFTLFATGYDPGNCTEPDIVRSEFLIFSISALNWNLLLVFFSLIESSLALSVSSKSFVKSVLLSVDKSVIFEMAAKSIPAISAKNGLIVLFDSTISILKLLF